MVDLDNSTITPCAALDFTNGDRSNADSFVDPKLDCKLPELIVEKALYRYRRVASLCVSALLTEFELGGFSVFIVT